MLKDIISCNDDNDLAIKYALQSLSNYENELLYYKYWEGLTVREIAIKLNKPRSTIHYALKGILKKLKKILE
jgi:RNA polymerase sigma factor (sigma-70 family)